MELPYLRISLTSNCNANCPICHNEGQKKANNADISLQEYEKVAKLLVSHFQSPRVVFTGGEPLLFPNIFAIVKIFKSHGYTVGLVTNGTLLDESKQKILLESGLDTINISLNSLDRVKYRKFYGIDEFFTLKKNLETLDKYFKYPQKKINWVISGNPDFENEIPNLSALSQEYKYIISFMFDINYGKRKINILVSLIKKILFCKYGEPIVEKINKYKRYKEYLKFDNGSIWEFDYLQRKKMIIC